MGLLLRTDAWAGLGRQQRLGLGSLEMGHGTGVGRQGVIALADVV